MTHKIRVAYGEIKKESVFIDPSVTVNDSQKDGIEQNNIIAIGESAGQLLKKLHGKK
jgi:hypothetical protein